jgi:flagellar hook-length control protein FliK
MIGTTTDQIRNTGKSSTLLEAKAQTEFTVPIQPSAESTTPTTAPSISEMAFIRTKPELPNISALHQIVDSVGVLAQQHKTEVRLHLKPESLGQVLVHLDFTGDHISVRMLAETSQAQKLIHDHLSQLKDAFATQGLQINGLSVNISNDASTFDLPGRQSNDETRQPAQNPINPLSDESNQPVTTGSTVNGWLSLHSVDYHV